MTKRLSGYLMTWQSSQSGGWGIARADYDDGGGRYFLHRNNILRGEPLPGARLLFTPLPKRMVGLKRATEVEVTTTPKKVRQPDEPKANRGEPARVG